MFHKVQEVNALPDYRLRVLFAGGETKIYDVRPLFGKLRSFLALKGNPDLFSEVSVDVGGHGVVWNDDLDLSCDELFANGQPMR